MDTSEVLISAETIALSDLADVKTGSSILNCKPSESNPAVESILYYKGLSCTRALHGQMGAPSQAEVSAKFDGTQSAKKILVSGDILIPRTFKKFGCGIYDGSYGKCYANRALFVIRGKDPLVHNYLSVIFRTQDGEDYVRNTASATKSFDMSTITLTKLKLMKMPLLSRDQMQHVCDDYEKAHSSFYRDDVGLSEGKSTSTSRSALEVELREKVIEQKYEIERLKSELDEMKERGAEKREHSTGLQDIAKNVEVFLQSATQAGMVSIVNGAKSCVGKSHSVYVTKGGHSIMENGETGGILIYKKQGRELSVVFSSQIGEADMNKFSGIVNTLSSDSSFPLSVDVDQKISDLEI